MKWKKEYKGSIWRSRSGEFYLCVQKRRGGKSHPVARYYWKVSYSHIGWIQNYTGLDYEMSVKKAMTAAKGAVLEARLCASIDA